jgi:hypothetical protein
MGVCAPARRVGETCDPRGDECGFLEFCLPGPGGIHTCQVGAGDGETCGEVESNTGVHCRDDGYCSGAPGLNTAGVCRPLVIEGGSCKEDIFSCQAGLRCTIGPYTCVRKLQLGEPCTERFACASGLRCRPDPGQRFRCQVPGERGEGCREDLDCSDATRCVGGACVSCQ